MDVHQEVCHKFLKHYTYQQPTWDINEIIAYITSVSGKAKSGFSNALSSDQIKIYTSLQISVEFNSFVIFQ